MVVQPQPGASRLWLHRPAVEVSYDGGDTWTGAPVRRGRGDWRARVRHPREPGSVSLRAIAAGTAGSSVELTIVDAYRIR